MAALQFQTPADFDPFAPASQTPGLGAVSAEGRKIEVVLMDVYRRWQARGEVLLRKEWPVTGHSLEGISESLTEPRELHNRRRLFLLDRKYHSPGGLGAAEEEEL